MKKTSITSIVSSYSNGRVVIENEVVLNNVKEGRLYPSELLYRQYNNGPYGNPWGLMECVITPQDIQRILDKPCPEDTCGLWQVRRSVFEFVF